MRKSTLFGEVCDAFLSFRFVSFRFVSCRSTPCAFIPLQTIVGGVGGSQPTTNPQDSQITTKNPKERKEKKRHNRYRTRPPMNNP